MVNKTSENGNDNNSDTLDNAQMNSIFSTCEHVHSQSLGPKYILHVSATSESEPSIAVALSDFSCETFQLTGNHLTKLNQFKDHSKPLINCKFSPTNNNLLYTGSNDGTIKLWDLRTPNGSACTFTDTTVKEVSLSKPLTSFDVSPCDRLLAAGTELVESDAYILFWDIRNTKLLGAYWDSHLGEITEVMFHPEDTNKLMSGSTDGLINIYDLSESSEDDALQSSLNTEALVEHLQWFSDENLKCKISCITSEHDLQLWEVDDAEPYKRLHRCDVASQLKEGAENVYLTKTHPVKNSLMILCGSNGGQRNLLKSLYISNGEPCPAFQLGENTQIVRDSWINEQNKILLTGGEDGILDIWKPDFSMINFKSFKRK